MRHIGALLLIYGGLVVDTALAGEWLLRGFRPDVPCLVLVGLAILLRGTPALVWAFLLGVALDGLGRSPLGIEAVLMTALAGSLQTFVGRYRPSAAGLLAVTVAVTSLVHSLVLLTVRNVALGHSLPWEHGAWEAVGTATYSSLLAVLIALVVKTLWLHWTFHGRGAVGLGRQ